MPRYKGSYSKRGPETIAANLATLQIPNEAATSDDHLDAWVAWRLASDFLEGSATMVGTPAEGAYLLPKVEPSISAIRRLVAAAQRKLSKAASRGRDPQQIL